jgi:hypothetical protein
MQVTERDVRGEHGVLQKRDWASGVYPFPSALPSKFADKNSTNETVYFNYRTLRATKCSETMMKNGLKDFICIFDRITLILTTLAISPVYAYAATPPASRRSC